MKNISSIILIFFISGCSNVNKLENLYTKEEIKTLKIINDNKDYAEKSKQEYEKLKIVRN